MFSVLLFALALTAPTTRADLDNVPKVRFAIQGSYKKSYSDDRTLSPAGLTISYVYRNGISLGVYSEYAFDSQINVPNCDHGSFGSHCKYNYLRTGFSSGLERRIFGTLPYIFLETGYVRNETKISSDYMPTLLRTTSGLNLGGGTGVRILFKRFSVGPFFSLQWQKPVSEKVRRGHRSGTNENLSKEPTLLLSAGLTAAFTLPLTVTSGESEAVPEMISPEVEAVPAETEKSSRGPLFYRIRTGPSLWGAWELAQLGVGRKLSDHFSTSIGVGWGIDQWLCNVVSVQSDECVGQRWNAYGALEYAISPRLSLEGLAGFYHRWSRETEPDPFDMKSSLRVVREEDGIQVGVGAIWMFRSTKTFALGVEGIFSVLVPRSSYWPTDYIEEDPDFLLEPRLLLVGELWP